MKGSAIAASLAVMLSAAPVFAQAPAGAGQAGRSGPGAARRGAAGAAARRRRPRSRPAPRSPSSTSSTIANLSAEGKISTAKVQALMQKKQAEAQAKSKALADAPGEAADERQRHERGGARPAREGHRAHERRGPALPAGRAGRDQRAAAASCRASSSRSCSRSSTQLVKEKGLHVLLSAADAGVAWAANPGLDLTLEVDQEARRDRPGAKPAAPAAAAPRPPASRACHAQAVGLRTRRRRTRNLGRKRQFDV